MNLGSTTFKTTYELKYPYVVGSMVKGISSVQMVTSLAKENIMSYFGSGGLPMQHLEKEIDRLVDALGTQYPYGVNLLCNTQYPEVENQTIELFLRKGITKVEASAFAGITSSLVWYRVSGLERKSDGSINRRHLIQAKISRPEVAKIFLRPAPKRMLKDLIESGKITQEQADMSQEVPMADCICVESDSGGHTDKGVALAVLPSIIRLKDRIVTEYGYKMEVFIGAAGGVGTPEAAAAMFILGADFVQTGSINQCTIEAGTSNLVKDILQKLDIQDTGMAPAGDMFEIGSKVQVVRKGVFFPAKANKLYEIYRQYDSMDDFSPATTKYLEEKIFKKSLATIEAETRAYLSGKAPEELEKMDANPKIRMVRIFQWYFGYSNRMALSGTLENKIDFQIHCGPAMGACNSWLKGTPFQNWSDRSVVKLADLMMKETEAYLNLKMQKMGMPSSFNNTNNTDNKSIYSNESIHV